MQNNNKKITGFSLVELLLAITLSTIVIIITLQAYLGYKVVYSNLQASAVRQENMRFAANVLLRSITMTGYVGCARLADIEQTHFTDQTGQNFTVATSVRGYRSDAKDLPSYLKKVTPNTDVIVIKRADQDQVFITGNHDVKSGDKSLQVQRNPATETNRLLLLADCEDADLFEAKNYDAGVNITLKSGYIHHDYKVMMATVARYVEETFFISTRTNSDDNGNVVYGLYRVTNAGNQEELAENINSMQIKYGIDNNQDGIVDEYDTADAVNAVAGWQNVQSVVITLGYNYKNQPLQHWDVQIKLRERTLL